MLVKRLALALVAGAVVACAPAVNAQTVEITGDVTKKGVDVGTFTGEFTIDHFDVVDDQLVAVGRLVGTVNFDGKRKDHNVNREIALPVDLEQSGITEEEMIAAGGEVEAVLQECNVLHLVLGPLDLNLLGLEIHLNQVVLDIDADPTGGLLGQLLSILCGLNLGGILDLLGSLGDLAALLNFLLLLIGI